jgi:iron uptake system component EfeO
MIACSRSEPTVGLPLSITVLLVLVGCSSQDKSDAEFKNEIVASMHQLLIVDLQGLNHAAITLQMAAPTPGGRGWDADSDRNSIAAMKAAWDLTRFYWERAESTLGDTFPELDTSMDSRYEDQVPEADSNLFDGTGVTGMHAIERILYAPGPQEVIKYESSIPGSTAATWPADEQQALQFKTGLCQRLVDDSRSLVDQWATISIDLPVVFTGLTGLMSAQAEKVGLAVVHREESRYSEKTMLDLRWNLAGTEDIYALFRPWLATKDFGAMLSVAVQKAFDGLEQTYGSVPGDAIPQPPLTWTDIPTPDDQQSPFGKLYGAVVLQVDPGRQDSAVNAMNHVARALGLPEFSGKN